MLSVLLLPPPSTCRQRQQGSMHVHQGQSLCCSGSPNTKPELVPQIEHAEEPCVQAQGQAEEQEAPGCVNPGQ